MKIVPTITAGGNDVSDGLFVCTSIRTGALELNEASRARNANLTTIYELIKACMALWHLVQEPNSKIQQALGSQRADDTFGMMVVTSDRDPSMDILKAIGAAVW